MTLHDRVGAAGPDLDRTVLLGEYRRLRQRTRQLFEMLDPELYYTRPIALRNPIVFYEGHLPGFAVNTLIKKGLGRPGVDERLERIFARGIDPESESSARPRHGEGWPTRDEVQAFVAAADDLIEDALANAPVEQPGVPVLDRAEGVFTVLEHEAMHQETLLYMWHRIPHERKQRPAGYRPIDIVGRALTGRHGDGQTSDRVSIPAGVATLGARRDDIPFGWDNEFAEHRLAVEAFEVDRLAVSNAQFLEFVEAGGYADPRWWSREGREWIESHAVAHPLFWERHDGTWWWRGQFDLLPLPPDWPVYVSHVEAAAFARWRGGRLMTEAEYHRAAFGSPGGEREFPWGAGFGGATPEGHPAEAGPHEGGGEGARRTAARREPPASRGTFDFATWDPVPGGSHPAGQSAWGVHDLVGNGWEWTATPFAPFEGFSPMPSYPEYSADFFDGQHYVMKGASPVTDRLLIRRSLRNWFRPTYPYVYAKFRCAY